MSDPVSYYLLVGAVVALLSIGVSCWSGVSRSFQTQEWVLLVSIGALWCLVAWPVTIVIYGVMALDLRGFLDPKI